MKNLKLDFWPEKYINISPQYTKRCGIATFGGVCFLRKIYFVNIFMRKSWFLIFEITIELYSNLKIKNLDFLIRILTKSIFLRKHTLPNVAIPHLLVYCGLILIYFSGQKSNFKIFTDSPIIKHAFLHYKLKSDGKSSNRDEKIWNFGFKLTWYRYIIPPVI